MTNSNPIYLVLAGSGKTGRRVAQSLSSQGLSVRAAARSGTDTPFDWHDEGTYAPALTGTRRVYLVPPATSLDFTDEVGTFLDVAATAGVEHVTYLSARAVEDAPPEVALRAVELQLGQQSALSHTVLRPAWFMENFSESFLQPAIAAQDLVIAPAGEGAEAFISADDIAAVAVASLLDPAQHDGATYTLTGGSALTFGQAAGAIGDVIGRHVAHLDLARDQWLSATVAAGVPEDYAAMLLGLFDLIRSESSAVPTSATSDILHRDPVTFADFAAAHRDVWRRI